MPIINIKYLLENFQKARYQTKKKLLIMHFITDSAMAGYTPVHQTFEAPTSSISSSTSNSTSSWPNIDLDQFEEKLFTNFIDHFDMLDQRTYQQRYWVSDQYWTGEGPLFVYICGEYRCSVPDTRLYPFMVGSKYNARFLVLEHRFYGDSQPFDDWSLSSLQYLSAE